MSRAVTALVERTERELENAQEAERSAYAQWQEAYGAYEVARTDLARARAMHRRAVPA